jgi:hypothetical protein
MKKQILFLSLMLLVSAGLTRANYELHNETNKYGTNEFNNGTTISVYPRHEEKWINIEVGKQYTILVRGDNERIAWKYGNDYYVSHVIRKPKTVYIYCPSYLTWTWTGFLDAPVGSDIIKSIKINAATPEAAKKAAEEMVQKDK